MATLRYDVQPICLNCGKDLFGRADKKYCNDTCRNQANSAKRKKLKKEEPRHVYQISRDILRNRNMIAKMRVYEYEPRVVTRSELMDQGFNFEYYTNILETKKGRYHYCYEYGWLEMENGKILLVMTDRYTENVIRIKRDWEY